MKINGIELVEKNEGAVKVLQVPVTVKVDDDSFLHIGASPSPLTEKKGAIFKVDKKPVIPASSFKGAFRNQLEQLFINQASIFKETFNVSNMELIKPCLPASRPTKSEKELIDRGKYRREHCSIQIDDNNIKVGEFGICPVCYLMGCTGIMGFLRTPNLFPKSKGEYIDQTRIRIDRKLDTAAKGAKVDGEQVIPGTIFEGKLEIVSHNPNLGLEFGQFRKIGDVVLDKWLENWSLQDVENKQESILINIIIPALKNIHQLGGWKSIGAGKVSVSVG